VGDVGRNASIHFFGNYDDAFFCKIRDTHTYSSTKSLALKLLLLLFFSTSLSSRTNTAILSFLPRLCLLGWLLHLLGAHKTSLLPNMKETTTTSSNIVQQEAAKTASAQNHCYCSLPEETILEVMTYWDVATLVRLKLVCSTRAMDAKAGRARRRFETNKELRLAVRKYTGVRSNSDHAEELAGLYGWPIHRWDVSQVDDFSHVFHGALDFNECIASWNLSNATTLEGMFYYAFEFNQDISNWDISNVTNMNLFLFRAKKFDQPLSSWNTSRVTSMARMLEGATNFNQNLASWDTSNVMDMEHMLYGATSFDQDIRVWDVGNVTNMKHMFQHATAFHLSQDLSSWHDKSWQLAKLQEDEDERD
jgi:surface protein